MSPDNLSILKVLWRPGTQQSDRVQPDLDPEKIRLMDLEPGDWLLFAKNLAQFVPFFSEDYPEKVIGNWQGFFETLLSKEPIPKKGTRDYRKMKREINDKLKEAGKYSDLVPHLTLFYTFLKLLELSRGRFNKLSSRHLDFYYKEILKLAKRPARPDQVFLIFELAKLNQIRIPKGTALDADKDINGNKLIYRTQEEFFPNQAKLLVLKNRYVDAKTKKVKISHVASSHDGKGADFPDRESRWWPFGHIKSFPELEEGSFGFGIASHSLLSKEGTRRYLKFEFTFNRTVPFSLNPAEIRDFFPAV